jgi:hypothetical protein
MNAAVAATLLAQRGQNKGCDRNLYKPGPKASDDHNGPKALREHEGLSPAPALEPQPEPVLAAPDAPPKAHCQDQELLTFVAKVYPPAPPDEPASEPEWVKGDDTAIDHDEPAPAQDKGSQRTLAPVAASADGGIHYDVTVSSDEPTLTPYERAKAAMELARQRARQPRPAPEPPVRKPQRTPLEEVVARAEAALDPLEGMILVEEKALPIGERRVYRKMAFALQRAQEHLLRIRELATAIRVQ